MDASRRTRVKSRIKNINPFRNLRFPTEYFLLPGQKVRSRAGFMNGIDSGAFLTVLYLNIISLLCQGEKTGIRLKA